MITPFGTGIQRRATPPVASLLNHHETFSSTHHIGPSSDRAFGLVLTCAFALLALWPLLQHRPLRSWALAVSGAALIATSMRPAVLHPLNRIWTRFGAVLNRVISPAIMAIVFFFVFAPLAYLMRFRGKDPLRLRFDSECESYWLERQVPRPSPDTMRNQF
jgi:hypothetical protein